MSFVLPSFSNSALGWKRPASRLFPVLKPPSATDGLNVKPTENGAVIPETEEIPKKTAVPQKKPSKITSGGKPGPKAKPFMNNNKFVVPVELRDPFDEVWEQRRTFMEDSDGFVELKISEGPFQKNGSREIAVSSSWESIPHWEAYSCSLNARRSHLPPGIYQYVPKKGEGFPEDFTPFIEFLEAVNAKY